MEHTGVHFPSQRPRRGLSDGGDCSAGEMPPRWMVETTPLGARTTNARPSLPSINQLRNALSGPINDSQRFPYLQPIIDTAIGREKFGKRVATFWWKIIDEPDVFPAELWQLFLQSSLAAFVETCRPICVIVTWRRVIPRGLFDSDGHGWGGSTER